MEQNKQAQESDIARLNVSKDFSRLEASSMSPDEKYLANEALEVQSQGSTFYVEGWRLQALSLRSACSHHP